MTEIRLWGEGEKARSDNSACLNAASRAAHTSVHIPSPQIAVWVSIAIHLLGGIGILVGFMTRWAAALLILLCLGTAFGVHLPAGDPDNMMNFYKNLVMAGGLLDVIAYGPGAFAFDNGAIELRQLGSRRRPF